MRLILLVLLFTGFVFAQEQNEKISPELEAQIKKLIEQLGNDDLEVRESATRRLIEIGKAAEHFLEKQKDNEDPEVAARIKHILKKLNEIVLLYPVETGHINEFTSKLMKLGLDTEHYEIDSFINEKSSPKLVCLPPCWAQVYGCDCCYEYGTHLEVLSFLDKFIKSKDRFDSYLESGGKLLIFQPNPRGYKDDKITPEILPYKVTFNYDNKKLGKPVAKKKDHSLLKSLTDDEVSTLKGAHTIEDFDKENYEVILEDDKLHSPILLTAKHGKGKILIYTGNEPEDKILRKWIDWLLSK